MSPRSMSVLAMIVVMCAAQQSAAAPPEPRESAAPIAQTMPRRQSAGTIISRFGFDQRPSYLERNIASFGFAERHYRFSLGRWYESRLSIVGEGPMLPLVDGGFSFRVMEDSASGPTMVRFEARADGRLAFRAVALDPWRQPRSDTKSSVYERVGLLTLDESIRLRDIAFSAAREFRRRPIVSLPRPDGFVLYAEIAHGRRSTFMAPWSPDEQDLPALFRLRRRAFEIAGIWVPL